MGVAAKLRHNVILEHLRRDGRIYVKELAQELGFTEVTIRRDLVYLHNNGLLQKAYGGAILVSPDVNPSVRYRQSRRNEAKKIIGKLASTLIYDEDVIYLEAGSTCYEIIPHLTEKRNLTVIVNSLNLMRRLHEMSRHKIIIIGGQYRYDRMDMIGPGAEIGISQLSGYKAFTGADDITIDSGISGADTTTVSFTKMVLKRASKVIFVGDRTKFDNPALYKIADLDQIDYIVTERKLSDEWHQVAKQKNIQLLYPDESETVPEDINA